MEGREDCLFCLYLLRVYNASWIEIFLSQLIYIIYFDGQNKIVTVMYIVISISKRKYYLTYISNIEQQYNQITLLYDSVTHHTDLLSRHSACSQFHSCWSFLPMLHLQTSNTSWKYNTHEVIFHVFVVSLWPAL